MKNTRRLATYGILLAIFLIFQFTPLGYPRIGPYSATLMHIPVIIGILYLKDIKSAILFGTIFGLTSLLGAVTQPTPLNAAFLHPLVSILPRILVGIVTFLVYKLLDNKMKSSLHFGIVGATAAITNTLLVVSAIALIFGESFGAMFISIMAAVFITNAIPEAIIGFIIGSAMARVIRK